MPIFLKSGNPSLLEPSAPVQRLLYLYLYLLNLYQFNIYDTQMCQECRYIEELRAMYVTCFEGPTKIE
jgi:hypothetical protein